MSPGKLPRGGGTQAWKEGFDERKGGKGNFITQTNSEGTAERNEEGAGRVAEECHMEEWKGTQVWHGSPCRFFGRTLTFIH